MYFAVGSVRQYRVADDGRILFISPSVAGGVFAVLTTNSVQLWSSGEYRLCLSELRLNAKGGSPVGCWWHPAGKHVCIATSRSNLILYKVHLDDTLSHSGVRWSLDNDRVELCPLSSALRADTVINLLASYGNFVTMCSDEHRLYVTTSSGYLVLISWGTSEPASVTQAVNVSTLVAGLATTLVPGLDVQSAPGTPNTPTQWPYHHTELRITSLSASPNRPEELTASFSDGSLAAIGLKGESSSSPRYVHQFRGARTQPGSIPPEKGSLKHIQALNGNKGLLAVAKGCTVLLLDLANSLQKRITLTLEMWGYREETIGVVRCMQWSPDEEVLAVGFSVRGMAVFHWTGVCVMTSLPRGGVGSDLGLSLVLDKPAVSLAWDTEGYHLFSAQAGSEPDLNSSLSGRNHHPPEPRLFQLSFIKAVTISSPAQTRGPHVILTAPRAVWLYHYSTTLAVNWDILSLPASYISLNYPLRYVAMSDDGQQMVACGARGCALYSLPLRRWRLFGVQEQESEIECVAPPVWCTNMVVCLPVRSTKGGHSLLFFPKYHMDRSSLLLTIPLDVAPKLLDAAPRGQGSPPGSLALLVLDASGKITWYQLLVTVDSALRPYKVALSLAQKQLLTPDIPGPVSILRLLPYPPPPSAPHPKEKCEDPQPVPPAIILLTKKGELMLISPPRYKAVLARNVTCFWIDPSLASQGFVHLLVATLKRTVLLALAHPHHRRRPAAAVALGQVGRSGSGQLPAHPAPPHTTTILQDADLDACPIGVLTGQGLLISGTEGVSHRGGGGPLSPSFNVHVRTLPYIHAVLLSLFLGETAADSSQAERQACATAALEVARGLREHDSFVDVMDYLLHSVLHCHDLVETQPHTTDRQAVLRAVLKFLANYSEFHEILVHCLRKADPGMWPLVFAQCPPLQLFDSAVAAGRVTEAALLLRVLQFSPTKVPADDPAKDLKIAAGAARKLFPMTIARHKFDLSAEILRFLGLLRGELLGLEGADEDHKGSHMLEQVEPGLVSESSEDPLLGSAWLRGCVVAEGRRMLTEGTLRSLITMLESLGLSPVMFINRNWAACRPQGDWLASAFDVLHLQFGVPRGTHLFPTLGDSERTVKLIAGHPRVVAQLKQAGGWTPETLLAAANGVGCLTPTQMHLLLIPVAMKSLHEMRETCAAAGCHAYVLLLSVLLLDYDTICETLRQDSSLVEPLVSCLKRETNAGYRPLLQRLVPSSKA